MFFFWFTTLHTLCRVFRTKNVAACGWLERQGKYVVAISTIYICMYVYVFIVNGNDAAMHSSRKCVNDDEYKTAAAALSSIMKRILQSEQGLSNCGQNCICISRIHLKATKSHRFQVMRFVINLASNKRVFSWVLTLTFNWNPISMPCTIYSFL